MKKSEIRIKLMMLKIGESIKVMTESERVKYIGATHGLPYRFKSYKNGYNGFKIERVAS